MDWKRRDEEDIHDSLVVQEGMIVKFLLVPVSTFSASSSRVFQQEENKKQHRIDTQRPNITNYLLTLEAQDHTPLATLPCLPEQCNHCGKKFSRKSRLSKHMLVVHGASRPSKILQDKYLAKLMERRMISFFICYIAFKTRFKKHMKRIHVCNLCEKGFQVFANA